MAEEERVALLSDTNTSTLIDDEAATEYTRYGWFGKFRRSPTFAVLVAAMALFTDMIVYGIVVPILPLIVQDRLGLDSKAIGFLFGCYAIGLLAATPIFAVLSDKYRTRKIPMLFGTLTLAVCSVLFGVATTYWQLVAARIAQGASGGASWTLSLAMLADRFGSGPKLGIVMGTVLSANTLGNIIGPLVGGFLYQYWGYVAPFAFCAILAFCGLAVMVMMVEPTDLPSIATDQVLDENSIVEDEVDNINREFSAQPLSILDLILDWDIINICLAITVVASILAGIEPILPIHLRELNANASQIGLIFIAIAIPTFLSPAVGYISFHIGQRKICGIGIILMGIATPLIALPKTLWLVILPLSLFGTAYSIATTPSLPLLAHYMTQKGGGAYGQIYALWNMAYSIGMFIGPVIAGLLFELYEFKKTLIILGFSAFAVTPLLFAGRLFRNDRRSILLT